ncbi:MULTISPECIES: D-amino-acid transaminase [Mammaliicoccus]|uniref:D-alanine aminotransferase n=1 Tax=Mammaliicoccus vitulinus TaxID=71237 RepID=A0A2T4PTN5_9STAP|nr:MULTISPECIES: D-amino-acid transaminase [Mammaliicoccus]HAL09445.1 D-amino-acid transaminase [Staphylococcus sp.]PTI29728.1 D-amino-acid transaminase [Mammaliicoccus vitulinus]PTI37849.1 D-amino-acid transaminase [Mammaliicoccus vitulinus]PTI73024.1 D-amino-acid transaminase [Mammaliicoccus vitulinus]RIN23276.1 D-amino-acid transaminase [Mammaliicoccus vitulinus]
MTYIFINDEFVDESEGKINYSDRGYNFGDGIYEYIRIYDGKVFTSKEHYERLFRSAKEIGLNLEGYSVEGLTEVTKTLAAKNNVVNGGVYIQVTRGVAPRNHPFPDASTKPVFSAFSKSYDRPYEELKNGVKAITVDDIRWLRCDIKSLNLLGNVLAKEKAAQNGAAEAIMHRDQTVTEGSSSNVYAVKGGKIYTHPANNLILNGITRRIIKKSAEALNIPFIEEAFTLDFLNDADEVIISSTSIEVMPVIQVNDNKIGDGKVGQITKQLQKSFDNYIESEA